MTRGAGRFFVRTMRTRIRIVVYSKFIAKVITSFVGGKFFACIGASQIGIAAKRRFDLIFSHRPSFQVFRAILQFINVR